MHNFIAVSLVALLAICNVVCRVGSDEIKFLPGLDVPVNFKHYSGYLKVSNNIQLHYWFVESQRNPSSDPLVLWMNGGPGCSSLEGLLAEHGPFLVTPHLRLKINNYSWNKIANVLYLEAPAGVGFSFATDENVSTNDDDTALHNYIALVLFFRKYPMFQSNEFYITGESYGGVYVPTLARHVMRDKSINFKGMMIGNGLTNYHMNDDSLLYFQKYHGLISERLWDKAVNVCCAGEHTMKCSFSNENSTLCAATVAQMYVYSTGLNVYNLYQPCYGGVVTSNRRLDALFRSNKFIQDMKLKLRRGNSESSDPPCTNSTALTTYLNKPLVRKILGIPDFVSYWTLCSDAVSLSYQTQYGDMTDIFKEIIDQEKYRVWLYNGDFDMACNYLGQQWFLDSLGYPLEKNYTRWTFMDEFNQPQAAGYYYKYFPNITFTTVSGAGHMVPTDKPLQAFMIFQAFLENRQL